MAANPKMITEDGKPVSHFSLRDRQREATQEPFVFDVDGEFFTMGSPVEADWRTTADLSTGDVGLRKYVAALLGDDYERFAKLENISTGDINALIEAATKHYTGATRGE